MSTPHKNAEVIKAWADGRPIQYKDIKLPQYMWATYARVPESAWGPWNSDNRYTEWRIKPETVKYRRYLYANSNRSIVGVVNQPYQEGRAEEAFEKNFIRWIDTEWQEVEV